MGTNDLTLNLTPVDDPNAKKYGVTTDNNRNEIVYNGVFQDIHNGAHYTRKRMDSIIGTPITISGFNGGTDIITTASAHGLVAGDAVRFLALESGALPGGIDADEVYFWLADSSTTGKVSLTPGGSAVDISGAGSGPFYVFKLPILSYGPRSQNGCWVGGLVGGVSSDIARATFTAKAGEVTWFFHLQLEHGHVLTSARLMINPHDVVSLPGTMPKLTIVKVDNTTGGTTEIAHKIDDSANAGAYNVAHDLAILNLTEKVDLDNYSYRIDFKTSSGDPDDNEIFILSPPRITGNVIGKIPWV